MSKLRITPDMYSKHEMEFAWVVIGTQCHDNVKVWRPVAKFQRCLTNIRAMHR
jgi:hypothetical protein